MVALIFPTDSLVRSLQKTQMQINTASGTWSLRQMYSYPSLLRTKVRSSLHSCGVDNTVHLRSSALPQKA